MQRLYTSLTKSARIPFFHRIDVVATGGRVSAAAQTIIAFDTFWPHNLQFFQMREGGFSEPFSSIRALACRLFKPCTI